MLDAGWTMYALPEAIRGLALSRPHQQVPSQVRKPTGLTKYDSMIIALRHVGAQEAAPARLMRWLHLHWQVLRAQQAQLHS